MRTSTARTNGPPIYVQISDSIRRRIRSGKLRVGDRLESERRVAANFGVSLMTARQALQSLDDEGLIERRHGSGTFVRTPPINWNRLMGFTEQMVSRGMEPSSQCIGLKVVQGDTEMSEQLNVPPGTSLLEVERVRFANGEPVAFETCFLPLSLFPGLEKKPLDRLSLFNTLENEYGIQISHSEETIEARVAGKRIASLLRAGAHDPMLFIKQVLFAEPSRPVAISSGWYRAGQNVFKVIRTRPA